MVWEDLAMIQSLLSHADRKNRVHVLTLDAALAEDVRERLANDPQTRYVECVAPGGETISVADVEALAAGTVQSRVLVLDVRSFTLPRLMHAYNRVVGYNRRDLNERCFTVLIGDGPPSLFSSENNFDVMAGPLAQLRIDYHPALFFFDPFGHFPQEERAGLRIDAEACPRADIPRRLAKWFRERDLRVGDVRRYFRAHGAPPAQRAMKRAQRMDVLQKILMQRILEMAPDQAQQLLPLLSRGGLKVRAESLAINVYPLFFEDWVAELLGRCKAPPPRPATPRAGTLSAVS